jgi:hypothetical protein
LIAYSEDIYKFRRDWKSSMNLEKNNPFAIINEVKETPQAC